MGLTITIYVTDNYLQADQIVTCNPDIESAEVEPDWDFLVLACDGKSSIADRMLLNSDWLTQASGTC